MQFEASLLRSLCSRLPGANRRLRHKAALDAASAGVNHFSDAVLEVADFLQVWKPAGPGLDVGMADEVASRRMLATEFTNASHDRYSFRSLMS